MSQVIVARLVIECSSPMAVSTGGRDTGFDTQLVRDVNGLPLIPATLGGGCLATSGREPV